MAYQVHKHLSAVMIQLCREVLLECIQLNPKKTIPRAGLKTYKIIQQKCIMAGCIGGHKRLAKTACRDAQSAISKFDGYVSIGHYCK